MTKLAIMLGTFVLSAACVVQAAPQKKSTSRKPAADFILDAPLNESESLGRDIWYKSTAGNSRFHTYTFPQRVLGRAIDWGKFLNSPERYSRFDNFGLINDPDCCTPGEPGCPAQNLEETFGMDWCPGDAELLKFVGKNGYRDPACDVKDLPGAQNLQSPCDLEFGTSTGVIGFRKFPNPRFDEKKWRKLNNGVLGTWTGYATHAEDGSVEPPFRIGISCASCHVSLSPINPPADPNRPQWPQVNLTVGNQYVRMASILGSGYQAHNVEWQLYKHERPGATDTSAVPDDQLNNPGTINAIMNIPKRPKFEELVNTWRRKPGCVNDPNDTGKCWEKSAQREKIFHILKGGEDTVGAAGAVQRVYINIGSCAEQCWVNHLTDMRQVDPSQRNYGQTPFNTAQCRRDCPNFRAIEDRVGSIFDFLSSARPTDLNVAKRISIEDLVDELDAKYGEGTVERGRQVFAQTCARCHSTQGAPGDDFSNKDFRKVDPATGIREDWLGNDQPTPVMEVGTYACRAFHSNHMKGHIWDDYASEDYRKRPVDPSIKRYTGGGRGYYRNISLLSAWAFAPFMHNNAVGPDVCANVKNPKYNVYTPAYVTADGKPYPNPPACVKFDGSVEGRVKLFEASMEELLNPDARIAKISRTDKNILFELTPPIPRDPLKAPVAVYLMIPKGTDITLLGGFRHKEFIADFVQWSTDPAKFKEQAAAKFGSETEADKLVKAFAETRTSAATDATKPGSRIIKANPERLKLYFTLYGNCPASIENGGHRFGHDLKPEDKKALTAFVMTL